MCVLRLLLVSLLAPTSFGFAAGGISSLESQVARLASSATTSRSELEDRLAELVSESGGGIPDPALSPMIEGDWELLYTTKSSFDWRNPLGRRADGTTPGVEGWFAALSGGGESAAAASSSPIQRAVTSAFSVTQSIRGLQGGAARGRVEQLVRTPLGELRLNAAATARPAAPRRVSFAFDEGYFQTEQGLRLPYPVPFKLLGKEAEGWLDTEFLGDELRISTGNKGTTFVLRRGD
ncbi:hypothetical protein EMIHUDRAFT_238400 [Emiliania huxleyi CCMP1516]|jgi:hypothetical protein|uniref:Plastid lipid-associated protein/fibrillin conserved domain-containing protein n=3 Tax=Emiliania huxleyi TaxID=2903 RepID=A0A0D3I8G0_EMIH1|nr:hypothetical protein EMIHUDRAFT_106570 [Emiliania huxleyi CCMP1516]XP_005776909.1 hypothetical protein EMIHUDRAFT_238400 [Emiliania huxleyi CCMP1516]EOD07545.1 hypothetical protein EMIHUDRAFT_106570 [Emiliania huxleyi CCMP1516]EOD24480.1 hypothetical protein EMIHUDRAFT_238400 [Emiliania huxleyi CCMP1516]|eukprot:XP_005759974.1 hypothetical protein EMIHUDRAFT_106570 [Emiliania huxleyi CCMP1516]